MKNRYNYTFLLFIIFAFNNVKAQKIVGQQSFDIPLLGSNGNQNPLYFSINKSDGLLYFYATAHQNGDLWTIGYTTANGKYILNKILITKIGY